MKKIEKVFTSDIHFQIRSDMELLFAACNLALFIDLSKAAEYKEFAADSQVMDMLRDMRKKASKHMLHELDSFFSSLTIQLAFFVYSLERGKTGSIPELLETLEKDNEKVLFSYLVKAFVDTHLSCEPKEFDIKKVCDNIDSMLSFVESANVEDGNTRDKLVEFLGNPTETKQRYCLLLRNFYEKLYKPCEDNVYSYLERAKMKYNLIFRNDPTGFFNNYLNIAPEKFHKKLEIHVSCFHQVSILVLQPAEISKPTWIGLGGNNDLNIQHKNNMLRENIQRFFKLFSDKTRFDMLCLLKERSWYNQEMAEKLGTAPSTINHHFGALLEAGIVTMEREDHRMYYSIRKERLKDLLDKVSEFLLS